MAKNHEICIPCAAKDDFKQLRDIEEGVAQLCHVHVWLIHLGQPLNLRELLRIAVEHEAARTPPEDADLDWNEVVEVTREQLIDRSEMLSEYFAIEVTEDGMLASIPLLLKSYMPSLAKLPNFLLRLGPHVDWDDEKGCFESFLRELAAFYAPEGPPGDDVAEEGEDEAKRLARLDLQKRRYQLERTVENVLFPAFRQRLVATSSLRKGVVEVADLKGLYRVFERC